MRLSIITDEISANLEHALQVCRDLQVDTVELRVVGDKNIVFHDLASLLQIRTLLQKGGFRVCSIASPFLKSPLWTDEAIAPKAAQASSNEQAQEWDILQRSFELAHLFDAPFVRTFSFLRVPDPTTVRSFVRGVIAEAVRRTEEAGLKLLIENEHACNIATGEETGWLLRSISTPAFGVIWDPGNAAMLESRPFPDGYQHVRGRVYHVHVKDVNRNLQSDAHCDSFVKVGTGSIDYVGQFRALARDGYDGMLSLETHYIHPEGGCELATRESYAGLRTLLREADVTVD
ncbi:MAG: sugar phosphate isomerase/epimerase [Ktedonobacteraceae bacterium]|nr:sugar phosphate isomerase/epimerase [Ktedonobacteraceae bacterium]